MTEKAKFWCPNCGKETSCPVYSAPLMGLHAVFPFQAGEQVDREEMRHRSRICKGCDREFETVELNEKTFQQIFALAKLGATTLKAQSDFDSRVTDPTALLARFFPHTVADDSGQEFASPSPPSP